MDFNSSVKTLQFYLDNQSFLQKISSLEELEYITTPVISLLLTQKGDLFHLPEDKMFEKGIFFLNDDWIAPEIMSKDRLAKNTIIKSSADLFDSFIENKMIKSGYWDLFNSSPEIELIDSILVLKKIKNSDDNYDLILIKGPMNEKTPSLPSFRHSANLLTEFTYSITPHARPPRFEHFLSYRDLVKSTKLKWSIHQIKAYLESIWCEKTPSTILSRLNILFESSVLFVENNMMFNSFLQVDKEKQARAGIPSNFTIGICGGYARGEYSKNSDLDLLLIHEGNDKLFLQVGEALDQVLRHVSTLELCKMENFKNLNFHENSLSNILEAFLKGDEACLGNYQKKELHNMLDSIETLRQVRLTLEERKDGISKYCWSIYKSIINMVPIYEKPIGKGDYLRNKITQMTKKSLHVIIPILLRVTDSLSDEKDVLGEYLRVSQPYVWDSIFKKYSVLTALQDMSTILAVLCEITFTSSTIDRFKVAMEKNIITKEQAEKFISGYRLFSRIKYKLTNEIPVESLEIINDDIKNTIKEAYSSILQNLEPIESDEESEPIVYPLLVFSDLHWGLNTKLAKKCLTEIK
ncbi:MAG: nucleotidyltransferase domain-containing protein, partial [Candidatus Hodarchaeota archaeon]